MATKKKTLDALAKTIADHQANISRLSEAWGQRIVDHLDDADRSLIASLKRILADASANYKVNSVKALDQMAYVRRKIEEIRVKAFVKTEKELRKEAPDLIDNETKWSKRIVSELSGERAARFADLTPKQVEKVLENGVIQNKPWADWWTYTADADVQRIANVCNSGLAQGFTTDKIVQLIMGTEKADYTDGVLSASRASARNLARTVCSGLANQAKDEFYRRNDDLIEGVRWLSTLDGRTCPGCGGIDRQAWKVNEPHPVPPLHPSCYDDQTRVLTDKGLKHFADLDGTERFFSFNPETEKIELVKAVRTVRYPVNEKLLHFSNARFDLMVTKNHKMFGYLDAKGCIKGYRFYEAAKMPKWSYRIPSGGAWKGVKCQMTERRVAWLKFMAYWLADGSVTKRSGNHYQIKIAQFGNGWMKEDLKALPFDFGNQESCLMFSNRKLGKYLSRFGHALEKYVPKDIKDSSPEEIKVFLDAFAKTDGCVRDGKVWKGYQFKPTAYFFTSSQRMCSDLCELILKAGGRPSVSVDRVAGTPHQFRNGTYTINGDKYIITFCRQTGTFSANLKREEVDYSGDVFCIELERNHTIYVERNGKFCWCGNCRCTILPVLEGDTGEVEGRRPKANSDFEADAKREYEARHPGKSYDDLAASTRKRYYHKAIHDFEARTGKPAFTQVPGNMTFRQYFDRMTDQQKRDWLGRAKFEMWKSGRYDVKDFIPPYPDKAMTVKQLKASDIQSFNEKTDTQKIEKPSKKDFSKWSKEQIRQSDIYDALEYSKQSKTVDETIKTLESFNETEEFRTLSKEYDKAENDLFYARQRHEDKKTIRALEEKAAEAKEKYDRFMGDFSQTNTNMAKMAIKDHMGYEHYGISIPDQKHDKPETFESLSAVSPYVDDTHKRFCRMVSDKYTVEGVRGDYSIQPILNFERAEYDFATNVSKLKIEKNVVNERYILLPQKQVHETAHCLEDNNAHIKKRCKEFLAYRTQGNEKESMNTIWFDELKRLPPDIQEKAIIKHPNGPYRLDEFAKRDKFYKGYCGKIYADGSTEIFSMGCERLVEEPLEFYKDDPEYFSFVLLLLRGEI